MLAARQFHLMIYGAYTRYTSEGEGIQIIALKVQNEGIFIKIAWFQFFKNSFHFWNI